MTVNSAFPKVLIIGETFRFTGGGGITLINLFKGWNADNLAVITERIKETSSDANCKNFYRLGHLEIKFPFPFNYINKIDDSGDVKLAKPQNASIIKRGVKRKTSSRIKYELEKAYYRLLVFLGLSNSNYQIIISPQLLKWIKDYSPDIIYAQPFRYSDMVFARNLKEITGIPLALHIMDDSVSFSYKPNLLYFYWRKRTKSVFRQLIDSSTVLMSISQFMSDEYYSRYKKIFVPVRNPVDLSQWLPYVKKKWEMSNIVNIIYTGRLAVPNINTLFQFCKVVDDLNKSGLNIRFDIYSIDNNSTFNKNIKLLSGVYINNPIPYGEIPKLIPRYDLVLLPIDFNRKGIKYAKYSISTKTSEYMISGVPILLIAPKDVALTFYAIENKCMFCVNDDSKKNITNAIVKLIGNNNLRESLAKKAFDVAKKDSDSYTVRQELKSLLSLKTNT